MRSFPLLPRVRIESLFVVGLLIAASTSVFRVLREPTASPDAPDMVARQFWIIVYAIVLGLAFHHRSALFAVARQSPLVGGMIVLALASTAWSADPALTIQSAVAVILTTLFGWYIVARYEPPGAFNLIVVALAVTVLASLAVVVMAPTIGLDPGNDGAWRGVLTHKNSLGRIAALTLALWLARAVVRRRVDATTVVVVTAAGVAILGSNSRTSLGVAALLIAGVVAIPLLRARFELATAAAMFLIALFGIVGVWLAANADAALTAFGGDATLTGRTDIWQAALDSARTHPLLGHGYDAFWGGFGSPGGELWSRLGDAPQHSHNGFLDVLLGLGIVGAMLYVALDD